MVGKPFVVPNDVLNGAGTSKASSGSEVQFKANAPDKQSDFFDRIPSLPLSMFYFSDTLISFAFEDKYNNCGAVRFFCEYTACGFYMYLGFYALKYVLNYVLRMFELVSPFSFTAYDFYASSEKHSPTHVCILIWLFFLNFEDWFDKYWSLGQCYQSNEHDYYEAK